MPVIDTPIEVESRDRYLTYALSVISSRALPDVRDGLKPVQRRILFEMFKFLGLVPTKTHRKSAAVVGGVLMRFHPHGDTACYEAMVRMAQDFSLRYPLVDGQGNFGSLDGDSPAAYRYTEVRLRQIALEVLGEIDEETVSFRDNFDGTEQEPVVLPSKLPNLLMNGAVGIAVGLATSIPPHNLTDIFRAVLLLIDGDSVSDHQLATAIKGPDFPTGCLILNSARELSDIYSSGRGSIRMRGEWKLEKGTRGKSSIIIYSIPYALDKSQLVSKIADLIIAKKVPQLVDVRDESTEEVRVVLELAKGANPEAAMAYLYKHSPLESNFAVNLTALVPGENGGPNQPKRLSLRDILQHFIDFRLEVVEKRLRFELKKLRERLHILEGFIAIFDALDEAIKIVRKSAGRQEAAAGLRKRFKLTEIQSLAVVDMRIYQLSKTSIEDIRLEWEQKNKRANQIEKILKSQKKILGLVRSDCEEALEKYGDKRLCKIVKKIEEQEFDESIYVIKEEVFAIVTKDGWLKRIRQSNDYRSTRLREGDAILSAHPLSTRDSLALITSHGNLYSLAVSDIPASSGYGAPVQKLLKFKDGETIVSSFAVLADEAGDQQEVDQQGELFEFELGADELIEGDPLLLVSKNGTGCIVEISGLVGIKRSGKRVAKLRGDDQLAVALPVEKQVALFSQKGYALRLKVADIPVRSGASLGVNLMGIRDGDALIGALDAGLSSSAILTMNSGSDKEVKLKDITLCKRGLKGKKILKRGEIRSVCYPDT